MKGKIFIAIAIIFLFSSCTSYTTSSEVESIITLEKNNYKLYNFDITYDSYKENIEGLLDESTINRDEEIIFGNGEKEYYGKDLIGADRKTMKEYKEDLFKSFPLYDLNTLVVNMKISDVIITEDNEKAVFAVFKREADTRKDPIVFYTITKYTLKEIESNWVISKIEKLQIDEDEKENIYTTGFIKIDNEEIELIRDVRLQ